MTHVRGHGRSSTPKKGTGAGGPGGRYSGGAKPGTGAGGPGGRYGGGPKKGTGAGGSPPQQDRDRANLLKELDKLIDKPTGRSAAAAATGKGTAQGIDSIIEDATSNFKDTIMKKGDYVSDPSALNKKSWEAAGMAPEGQHKFRSQYERLKAKYGSGWEGPTQAQEMRDYLSGVPVERGGGLGARDPSYGGSAENIDPELEPQRQELLRQISATGTPLGSGTDMASQLEGIRREGIGADLTPDQFFNFTQQLMASDPTPGNMAYKQARPWSSGYGVGNLATPAMSMLREGIGSLGTLIPPEVKALGRGVRDAFGNLIPEGLKKDAKTMGRNFRTAAGDITGRPFEGFGGMLKGAYAYPEPFGTSGRAFAGSPSVRPGGGGGGGGGGGQQFAGQP